MSAKAGTIQQTPVGINWTGGLVAAALLTALLTVALFAMSRSNGSVDPIPQTARVEVTDQLSGGPTQVTRFDGPPAAPTQEGIQVGNTFCHQCR